jgi:hypothetical protein
MQDPRNALSDERLAVYLNEATNLHQEIQTIMRNRDPERSQTVVDLVPVYNTVTSSLIVGLTMASWAVESIDQVYSEAIQTNQALVSDGDQYGGYLYRHIVASYGPYTCCDVPGSCNHCVVTDAGEWGACGFLGDTGSYPRCAGASLGESLLLEERRRIDSDPTIYLIRRTVTDQQLALL